VITFLLIGYIIFSMGILENTQHIGGFQEPLVGVAPVVSVLYS
jgi:hypothetical protein